MQRQEMERKMERSAMKRQMDRETGNGETEGWRDRDKKKLGNGEMD